MNLGLDGDLLEGEVTLLLLLTLGLDGSLSLGELATKSTGLCKYRKRKKGLVSLEHTIVITQ